MTGRVFSKLLFSFLLVLCIGTAVLDFSLRRIVEHSLNAEAEQSLLSKAQLLAVQLHGVPRDQQQQIVNEQALVLDARVTLLAHSGAILADSGSHGPARPASLTGPEIANGAAVRDEVLYVAVPADGMILRLGYPLSGLQQTLHLLRRDLLIASLLALWLAAALAAFIANRVARRLRRIVAFANRVAAGDLSARVEEEDLDEISEVAHALDATAVRLEQSFRELEGSRRELATLLDSMQEAVVGVTPLHQVSWSNAVMQRLSPGVAREGRPLVECVRDPEVLACVDGALKQREQRRGRATSFVAGRTYEVSAAPMPGGGAVAVFHDVTDVERTEKMRRDFVANVSHELRTPLTSISGYVETVLEGEGLSEDAREFLEIVLKNAKRMNRLTEDLLALANVEAGDYRVRPSLMRASALVEDAIESLGGMVMDSPVVVEPGELSDSLVLADADALNQVFGNLIENAMKYGKSGGRVVVGSKEKGAFVEFSVKDFGQGIGSEHLGRLFERFYRVDKARSRDSGGTGLGLAIAKHIVLAHGGGIRVESTLGAGATFLFTLPRAPGRPS
jgi:two-component system phosphate regulon sensor histidine kinase PhoR